MRYREYNPPHYLAKWIKLFWVFENRSLEPPIPETIVADGYPELIIHFRSAFAEIDQDGSSNVQPTAVACGQLTGPLILQSSSEAGMVGIRFQPNGMTPFIRDSMQVLTDSRCPAEDLFANVDSLTDKVMRASNDAQRIEACVRFLRDAVKSERDNTSIRRAIEAISRSHGKITVESLATLTGRSRRSLELQFRQEVGISPKMFCRTIRFRHLYDSVSESPQLGWVQTALDSGFFDQSHLIRDFRQFAGDSPASFLTKKTPFAILVNQA